MKAKLFIATLCAFSSLTVLAQTSQATRQGAMGSSNDKGVQIQGNTDIKATQEEAAAVAAGVGNTAQNAAGTVKSGVQIQGNTTVKAKQKKTTAVAVGKHNKAANEAGVIEGK